MHYKKIVATLALFLSASIISSSFFLSSTLLYHVPYNEVKYTQLSSDNRKQVDCLAENIYREAAHESKEGWFAVGFVTMNRLQSGNYANSVCGVVYQKNQFSWVGTIGLSKIDKSLYNHILEVATVVYMNHAKLKDVTEGATYYHANYVNPGWKGLEKTKVIGQHIFYRSKFDNI